MLTILLLNASLLIAAAFAAHALLQRQAPAMRHLVWVVAFAGLLLLPVAAPMVAKINVPLPGWSSQTTPSREAAATSSLPGGEAAGAIGEAERPFSEPLVPPSPSPLPYLLFGTWCFGFTLVMLRLVRGLMAVRHLQRRQAREIESPIPSPMGRPIRLMAATTDEPASALTWGAFRPVVLLPKTAEHWTPERLEAVLLHEFAHVRRFDFLSQLLAETACAIYWFNPLVWLGARAMREDAELAADDVVLGSGIRPSRYAEELLRIAAEIGSRRTPTLHPGIPTMNPTKIEARLQSVLAPAARRRGLTHIQIVATLAVGVVTLPVVAGLQAVAGDPKPAVARQVALSRIKQVALGMHIYANDYDDYLPYVQQTASAKGVIYPYVKNDEVFDSPAPGGRFLFNLNLAGVKLSDVEKPSETPSWMEDLPDKMAPFAVAYVDGHAKSLMGTERQAIGKLAETRFKRDPGMRPLPKTWMVRP